MIQQENVNNISLPQWDLVIYNGMVLTMDPGAKPIENGCVCIRDSVIAAVKKGVSREDLASAKETIDADQGIILPGLINCHTHLPMSVFRGMAEDMPLDTWLSDHILPGEARHIHPENVYYATLLSCAEMLLSGTTTCCDGYFLESVVCKAAKEAGIRIVAGQGVVDFPAPGVPDPSGNLDAAQAFINEWKDVHPAVTPSVFCHAIYTCSGATILRAKQLADQYDLLFQIHAAETAKEVEDAQNTHGLSPVLYLEKLGVLDENTLLHHCVWTDAADIEAIYKHGAKVSHNPESNLKLGAGIARIPDFLEKGIQVGLGTDGAASNNNLDMFGEMDFCAKIHKGVRLDPACMDAQTVLFCATSGAARAIGLGDSTGRIVPGKKADIIVADTRAPGMQPLYNPVSQLVYTATAGQVRDVVVEGRPVVRNRKLLTMDTDMVLREIAGISGKIMPIP